MKQENYLKGMQNFLGEARLLFGKFDIEGIVFIKDFFEENGEIYTAMSFIPGRSLKELMEERRQFSQRQLIRWAMQLCSALNYLHTQTPPIIHGDIKPANIMVPPRGDVCLIEFNVSFEVNGNTVLGYTEVYASPEQYIIALDSREGRDLPQ